LYLLIFINLPTRRLVENVRRRFAPAVGGGILQGYDTLKTYRCQDLLNDVSLLPKQALAMIQG
jgi:hypothetical protein